MQNRRYPISIQGQIFSVEEQILHAYSTLFSNDHGASDLIEAECLCRGSTHKINGNDRAKVLIKRRSDRDGFYLFRAPNTGASHGIYCIFNTIPEKHCGRKVYTPSTIIETLDGNLKVTMKKRLLRSNEQFSASKANTGQFTCLTLKAVLDLLWSEAKLNRWHPEPKFRKRLGIVCADLTKVAARILSQETPVSKNLLVHAPIGSNLEIANAEIVSNATQQNSMLLIFAPLKPWITDRPGPGPKLPIVGNFGLQAIFLPAHVWAKTSSKFSTEINLWEQGHNVMAIAQVVPQQSGNFVVAQVREVALMAVSDSWIPVYSQEDIKQELSIRNSLTSFIKPLRFDSSPDVDLPSFIIAAGDHYQILNH
ncbi:conserved hypothetical protein [Pseudomonas veronii]|uniref:DUF1173 family protein n=1 Tax=Pseudomonas veronii TaxID=76761 RepID=UPI001761FD9F|nr:DUF1173 family protein [Pseudomonas veronii]CAD0264185.1 conserved hypothetical protein [Pseudomonas veronii]